MIVKFVELNLTNFKSHQDLKVNFGEITKITGDNAKGKSSIGESISFLLYGTDLLGSKLDPTPVTYEAEATKVNLLLDINDSQLKLGREIIGGRNKYIINDVPSKATDFNQTIEQLFDKDLFLSLFNPAYYFTLHWTKQREMLSDFTATVPANKEVFEEFPGPQADKLSKLVKKHSLEDLEKIHRENRRTKDKELIAVQSRTKTLKEQVEHFGYVTPKESLNAEIAQFQKELKEKEQSIEKANATNNEISRIKSEIDLLSQSIDSGRNEHTALKTQEIDTNCYACGQELQPEAVEKVESKKEQDLQTIANRVNPLIKKRKQLRAELSKLEAVMVDDELIKEVESIKNKINKNKQELQKHDQLKRLQDDVKASEQNEIDVRQSLNESIFILDAIKAFEAKEAELQANKVQDLFNNLSIRLFDEVKSTGELKPTFVVQMDDKDYLKLSTAEKIKAGLELRDVLSNESGITVPCFVDNAESITKFKQPVGQLITAQVIAGKELEIINE